MVPTAPRGSAGSTTATPLRVFLSHTYDLGEPDEAGSFEGAAAAALHRARHAATEHGPTSRLATRRLGGVGRR